MGEQGVIMGNNILFTDRWADRQRGLYICRRASKWQFTVLDVWYYGSAQFSCTINTNIFQCFWFYLCSKVEVLNDDPRTPFYQLGRKYEKHRSPKAVAEALKYPPFGKICSAKPRRCQRNAAFIINTSFLDDPDDCLSDNLGPFRHNGQKCWYFVSEEDEGFIEIEEPTTMEEGVYYHGRGSLCFGKEVLGALEKWWFP